MQGRAAFAAGMAAARGLAVDGDQLRLVGAQSVNPSHEAVLEQRGVERVEHAVERVVRGNAVGERQKTAQEIQPLLAPGPDLHKIVRTRQGGGQHQKQNLRQGIEHLGNLARVLQRRKLRQQ